MRSCSASTKEKTLWLLSSQRWGNISSWRLEPASSTWWKLTNTKTYIYTLETSTFNHFTERKTNSNFSKLSLSPHLSSQMSLHGTQGWSTFWGKSNQLSHVRGDWWVLVKEGKRSISNSNRVRTDIYSPQSAYLQLISQGLYLLSLLLVWEKVNEIGDVH